MPHQMTIFPSESFVDLSMYQYGYADCEPLHSFGPATRNHFLFHYILEGRGTLISTNSQKTDVEYHLEKNQGFLIWPGQRNTYIADEQHPWVYTWVEFDGLKARELIAQSGLSFDRPVYRSSDEAQRERLKRELLAITQGDALLPLDSIGHLYHVFSALIQSSAAKKKVAGGSLKDFYLREALSYTEQNYQNAITVEDMASFCGLSRGYLSKIFSATLSVSPQEFIIQYRLNKACELLKVTEKPIGEISAMVGYPDQLHFSRVFHKAYGIPPSAWRRQNKLR